MSSCSLTELENQDSTGENTDTNKKTSAENFLTKSEAEEMIRNCQQIIDTELLREETANNNFISNILKLGSVQSTTSLSKTSKNSQGFKKTNNKKSDSDRSILLSLTFSLNDYKPSHRKNISKMSGELQVILERKKTNIFILTYEGKLTITYKNRTIICEEWKMPIQKTRDTKGKTVEIIEQGTYIFNGRKYTYNNKRTEKFIPLDA